MNIIRQPTQYKQKHKILQLKTQFYILFLSFFNRVIQLIPLLLLQPVTLATSIMQFNLLSALVAGLATANAIGDVCIIITLV